MKQEYVVWWKVPESFDVFSEFYRPLSCRPGPCDEDPSSWVAHTCALSSAWQPTSVVLHCVPDISDQWLEAHGDFRGTWRSFLPRALAKQSQISKASSFLWPSFDRIRAWVNDGCLWPSSISPVFAPFISCPISILISNSRKLYPFSSSKHLVSPANRFSGSHSCRAQTLELWQHQETEDVLRLSFG